ncbi:MAG: zinc-binding dehydrogenase [Cystobacter sp.]
MADKAPQLRSLVKSSGELVVSIEDVDVPRPGPNEVLVRIEAAPIHPSDLGLLFAAADLSTARLSGTKERPILTATIPERARKSFAGRVDQSLPVGNEGAGTVVATGAGAEALQGKKVAFIGGASYASYRTVAADEVLVLDEGTTASEGAAAFVNPLTALGMIDTLRREGHKALVHTAAASTLGQMLVRACRADGIPLVNVVRKEEQVALLREAGAEYVVNSSSPSFDEELTEAIAKTGATLAFDAIGGGRMASQLLTAMEAAILRTGGEYSRYGSNTHKQVYLYGALDPAPTELTRGFGLAWGLGGWLLFPHLRKIGQEAASALKARVARELKTTFATRYSKEISLPEMLSLEAIETYAKRTTGGKYLVRP